ncbi:MAG: histidine kinase, partial [Pseudomonadota bacterium]
MISNYLSTAQLELPENLVAEQLSNLEHYLAESALPAVRWEYQIPELGEGGACSLFGYLQDEPFKLNEYVAADTTNTVKSPSMQYKLPNGLC